MKIMKVTVKESTLVQPAEETPKVCLWTSNIDQLFKMHVTSIYVYRPPINGPGSLNSCSHDFFDSSVLKDSLSKVLVSFYPIAGRLRRNEKDGRAEINCVIDELGDFSPTEHLKPLIPQVDNSLDISSYPPLLVQLTRFKCGGVCLGVAMAHTVTDGASGLHFVNTWSDLSRGLDIKTPPFLDRTLLRARIPPTPSFPHIEHQPPPTMKNKPLNPKNTDHANIVGMFKVSTHQVNLLKSKCNKELEHRASTYVVISGHIWRCVSKARRLEDDQETMISIATDGRSRLNPPLPAGYFGNAIFHVTPRALVGDLLTRPLSYAVGKIQESLMRGDDEYYRSAIDYLELQPDLRILIRGPHTFNCPNIGVTSWARLPIYDADFGWGKPVYMGPGAIFLEGLSYILPNPPEKDGNIIVGIRLPADHMDLFEEYFYDI